MKKFISVFLVLSLCAASAYAVTQTDVVTTVIDKAEQLLGYTDEKKINDVLDEFQQAYADGDMQGVISCFDRKTQNAVGASVNIGNALISKFSGISVGLSDMFTLGVAAGNFAIEFSDREINTVSDTTAQVTGTLTEKYNDTFEGEVEQQTRAVFTLVKEDGDWHISNIEDAVS